MLLQGEQQTDIAGLLNLSTHYVSHCVGRLCHAHGVTGAPKLVAAIWAARVKDRDEVIERLREALVAREGLRHDRRRHDRRATDGPTI